MTEGSELRFLARVGTLIKDKWRVDAFLRAGSMAAVYAATHRNGNRGALKILHPHLTRDPAVRSRFLREAYLANLVSHAGAIQIIDDDVTDDGAIFLVMELLEGETLEERRQRMGGKLPPLEVLTIFDSLLEIVAAAHDKGVIHRDLKPENIFLTRDGVKVLDFGIARAWDAARSSEVTETGMVLGSPSFMAPEQARGTREEVDGRADIWSLGATMWRLLSGETVHGGETMGARIHATATNAPRPLRGIAPDVPRAIASVVDRALAFDREARWQDVRSMREALRWAKRGLEIEPPPANRSGPTRVSALERALAAPTPASRPSETITAVRPSRDEESTLTGAAKLSPLPDTVPPPAPPAFERDEAEADTGQWALHEHTVQMASPAAAAEEEKPAAIEPPSVAPASSPRGLPARPVAIGLGAAAALCGGLVLAIVMGRRAKLETSAAPSDESSVSGDPSPAAPATSVASPVAVASTEAAPLAVDETPTFELPAAPPSTGAAALPPPGKTGGSPLAAPKDAPLDASAAPADAGARPVPLNVAIPPSPYESAGPRDASTPRAIPAPAPAAAEEEAP